MTDDPRDSQIARSSGKGIARLEAALEALGDRLAAGQEVLTETVREIRLNQMRTAQKVEGLEVNEAQRGVQDSETRAKLHILEETLHHAVEELKGVQAATAVSVGVAGAEAVAPMLAQSVRDSFKPKRPILKGTLSGGGILAAAYLMDHADKLPLVGRVLEGFARWLETLGG